MSQCYQRPDHKHLYEALDWMERAAENGYAKAQAQLGMWYAHGLENVVGRNPAQALLWLRHAAAKNHAGAQYELGLFCLHGEARILQADPGEAFMLFSKAALQKHPAAQYQLGLCYHHGQGVSVDMEMAKKWMTSAAGLGNEDARKWLPDGENCAMQ
jgi:TPR repeat protein